LSDVINYRSDYRYMYEPFHPNIVPEVRAFRYWQYLRPDNDDPKYIEPARTVFSGRIRNDWVDAYNKRLIARKRMIKDVRANLFLKWMKRHFPEMPIVFIMRHPCAVASSRLNVRFRWYADELMLSQPELVEDFLKPVERRMRDAVSDPFENHIFFWCVENIVPLRQFARGEVHLAFYERYCLDARAEMQRLADFLGWPFEDRMLANVRKPSVQTRRKKNFGKSPILTGESLLDTWRKHVSEAQIRRAVDILKMFGLDVIYGAGSLPNVDAAYAMLQPAAAVSPARQEGAAESSAGR
jgi:hypothetical protein